MKKNPKLKLSKKHKKKLIVTKLVHFNCEKTEKINLGKKQKKIKLWQNLNNQIVTKLKSQIVTVVIVTVVTVVVIVKYFSKNNLTPQQPMRCSQSSFSQFSQCLSWFTILAGRHGFWLASLQAEQSGNLITSFFCS